MTLVLSECRQWLARQPGRCRGCGSALGIQPHLAGCPSQPAPAATKESR